MYITNIKEYLTAHENQQIRSGKSGAKVWEIEDKYILKYVQKTELPEPEVFTLYQNEAYFYQFFEPDNHKKRLPCLPETLNVQVSDDEILILMKKYQELSKEKISEELLQKIMRVLAIIHSQEIPPFLKTQQKQPEYLEETQINSCLAGWQSVLSEHPGKFDEEILRKAAEKINKVIEFHHAEEQILNHGDFHWDNLLQKENGDLVVCDWQGVGVGGASGDIGFLLSRLKADGINIEPRKVIELYCYERFLLTGKNISPEKLQMYIKAANFIVSFQCWYPYLYGSSYERVNGIYKEMGMD